MNPLTDELSDEAKAELAATFADLKRQLGKFDPALRVQVSRISSPRRPWELL